MAKVSKTITCAKCGACTTPCPVYSISGEETLSARGRRHLLEKGAADKHSKRSSEIFSRCLLCGACYAACPRGINTPKEVKKARGSGADSRGLSGFKKRLIQKSLTHPKIVESALAGMKAIAYGADRVLPKESGLRLKLALFDGQDTPTAQSFPLHQSTKKIPNGTRAAVYFSGCLATYLKQDITHAAQHCAQSICGYTLITLEKQVCCGMAFEAAGDRVEVQRLARKILEQYEKEPYAELPIFTSCATCFSHLRSFAGLFEPDSRWFQMAQSFTARLFEFSTFLNTFIKADFHFPTRQAPLERVVYHDPCHLRFPPPPNPAITQEPRAILSKIPSVELIALEDGSQCCGQGGLFHIAHPTDAKKISDRLLDVIVRSHPDVVVTSCSGCLIQIASGLKARCSAIKTEHLAQLISRHLV